MSKRIFLSLTVVAAVAAPAFAACGGSTNGGGNPEGGAMEASTMDAAKHPDSGAMDTGTSETGDDGGVVAPPTGMQLVKSTSLYVAGVTSDGYALYVDTANQMGVLYSVPVAGGSPTMIANIGTTNSVNVIGKTALIWENVGAMSGVGTFAVWTSANGLKMLGTSSIQPAQGAFNVAAVSSDGKYVIYNDGADTMGVTANIYIAGTDGTGKTAALVTGIHFDACAPTLGFGGDNGVAAYCTMAPVDGGAPDAGDAGPNNDIATVASFTGASFMMATVATNVFPNFLADDQGTHVLVESMAGGLQAYPIAGGSPVTVDAAGSLGFITKDGMSTFYTTTPANALKRATVVSPNPTTLVGSGFAGLLATSYDQGLALGYKGFDSNTGLTDLVVASATTMGTATQLVSTMDTTLYGDAFTADNSRVVFYNMIDANNGTGTLNVVPVTGGMPTVLGQTVWLNFSTSGTKILFNDNWSNGINGGNQGAGQADLEAIDTAQSAPKPKTLAGQADAYFYLTAAKDKVVYSWSYDNTSPLAGLYVVPVP
jgi:hypothetical protein